MENAVIALTFANQVESPDPEEEDISHFERELTTKKEVLCDIFKQLGHEQAIIDQLATRIHPVGSAKKLKLPTGKDWQAQFWRGCLTACKAAAKGALFHVAWKYTPYVKIILGVAVAVGGGVSLAAGVGVGAAVAGGVLCAKASVLAASAVATALGFTSSAGGTIYAVKHGRKEKEE